MKKTKKTKAKAGNKLRKILFIPDSHFPYEDKKAFALMLKAATLFGPDEVVICGDFADFYGVSSHSKDPNRALRMKEEVEVVKDHLDKVIALGADKNVFIAGNHCSRLERYLQDKAPELFNFISIEKILDLKKKGFEYVPYKRTYKVGKLNITHDVGSAGKYAHYQALDTFQHNIIIGHTHRLGYAVEGNAQGERHVTAMFGWLGDVNEIDYMHRDKAKKNWTLGFGTGVMDEATGTVYVVPIPIINIGETYSCLIEGQLVTL